MQMHEPAEVIAGVDLGSNSFHMVVARLAQGEIEVVDRMRERTLLAAGLDPKRNLTDETAERALSCLQRFGERLRAVPEGRVRAVGTNTLRQARNAPEFLERGQKALGHPIDIISGHEEARLIYLGVSHSAANDLGRRLVIDIGGGSTECIVGEGFEPVRVDSLFMGCVAYTLRFFPDGKIRESDYERAQIAARVEFESIERKFRSLGWARCIGSSGTILAIEGILRTNGFSDGAITSRGLKRLKRTLLQAGSLSRLAIPGLPADRAQVFPGGVAILDAAFESLKIEEMNASHGGLREGLLYDQLGRIRREDVRDRSIQRFLERYQVDTEQAGRVEGAALGLFDQAAHVWEMDWDAGRLLLAWAAKLHEVGLSVSYTGYHKHSAYLVMNGDMPGFSKEDQETLGAILLCHRRKFSNDAFRMLRAGRARLALKLCVFLRLSVCLYRSRSAQPLPKLEVSAKKDALRLSFPEGWLEMNPLARADFDEEASRLKTVGFDLSVS